MEGTGFRATAARAVTRNSRTPLRPSEAFVYKPSPLRRNITRKLMPAAAAAAPAPALVPALANNGSAAAAAAAAAPAPRANAAAGNGAPRRRNISYINSAGRMFEMLDDNPRLSRKVRELLAELRAARNSGEKIPPGFKRFLIYLISEELRSENVV